MEHAARMRRTVVVEGPLAFRMRRLAAARDRELGVQILPLPLLAARLAGGFLRPAESPEVDEAVRAAIAEGGFADLEAIRDLPGLARAVAATLRRVWDADLPVQEMRGRGARWDDVALIETRVHATLPSAALSPRRLRDAALERVHLAREVLGDVELLEVPDVLPVWRPLLNSLLPHVAVRWTRPGTPDIAWFRGVAEPRSATAASPALIVESCANPKAEVVEALRWARQLIASGKARPAEIALCTPSPAEWDAELLALAEDAKLPIHCSHGFPALRSWEGQVCAALGDVLLSGLNQSRVRRLLGYLIGREYSALAVPQDWWLGIERGATLHTVEQWRRAFERAKPRRRDDHDIANILIPILARLDQGIEGVAQLADILPAKSRALLERALHSAPPRALEYSLKALRVPDETDPGRAIVWGPARHLEAAPRRWVRMLGLTSRSWPRLPLEDPLLPDHLLPGAMMLRNARAEDERAFQVLMGSASGGVVASHGRRSSQGTLQGPSPLIANVAEVRRLRRSRRPAHAFSEADRLLARPTDLEAHPVVASATACWSDWRAGGVTVHDGRVRAQHPVVLAALHTVQSATSLQRMIRDPIAFLWFHGLGWRAPEVDNQPLTLPAADFGELVHALLKDTVDALEPDPGVLGASVALLQETLARTTRRIAEEWPLERAVPPALLWQHTLDHAARMALRALTFDPLKPGTRAWSEVGFGWATEGGTRPRAAPWDITQPVAIPDTEIRILGSIDRVDLSKAGDFVRVTDYKTGDIPQRSVLFDRGGDLQRIVYAVAAQALLPGPPSVFARLVYLKGEQPVEKVIKGAQVDAAIANAARFLNAAMAALQEGMTLPGPHPDQHRDERRLNALRLALPASWDAYCEHKGPAIRQSLGKDFTKIWIAA